MNRIKQSLLNAKQKGMALALTLPAVAMAQTTDPFDTALTEITGKVTSYGGALVGLAAVAVAFYVGIKFVKKIPKAA